MLSCGDGPGGPLLWNAWPAVLAGAAAGVLAACGPLWWLARRAARIDGEAAVRAKIDRLQGRCGVALARAEERARGREEAAERHEASAAQIRQAAEDAWRAARQAQGREFEYQRPGRRSEACPQQPTGAAALRHSESPPETGDFSARLPNGHPLLLRERSLGGASLPARIAMFA